MSSCQRSPALKGSLQRKSGFHLVSGRIPAHQIPSQLGPRPASALPMLHVFTVYDTVLFLAGKGKGRARKCWQAYQEATYAPLSLSNGPDVLDGSYLKSLGRFVLLLCNKTGRILKGARSRELEIIPPIRLRLAERFARSLPTSVDSGCGKECIQKEQGRPYSSAW